MISTKSITGTTNMSINKMFNTPFVREILNGLTYIQFGWTIILIMILVFASSYYVYVGHVNMKKIEKEQDINFNDIYYRISGFRCGAVILDNDLNIIYNERTTYSPCVTDNTKMEIIETSVNSLRGFNRDKFLFSLIVIVSIVLSGVFANMTKNRKITKTLTVAAWTIAHSVLFLVFYLDYTTAAKFSFNGTSDYHIITMVKDNNGNYYASPIIGKRLHYSDGIGLKLDIK